MDVSDDFVDSNAKTLTNELFSNVENMNILYKFKSIFLDLYTTHIAYNRTVSICDYLKLLRDKSIRMITTPSQVELKDIINKSIEESMNNKLDIVYY